jgi:hypothetical protein
MPARLRLEIHPQPDDTTCGPTCLHAVYRFWGEDIALDQVIRETPRLESGGTLAVMLACHALRRGYRARIYTFNLQLFDPTWFARGDLSEGRALVDLRAKLVEQARWKKGERFEAATRSYLEFLELGGELCMEDLGADILMRYLHRGVPMLTGLSSTYLYGMPREFGPHDVPDDVRGEPAGHFVVLTGYEQDERLVQVADPLFPNPIAPAQNYLVAKKKLVGAILLGILTYDANFLVLEPQDARSSPPTFP